jgi:maleylacetate reductase
VTPSAYRLRPVRVVFGAGALQQLGAELAAAGLRRAFVLSTPGRASDVARVRDAIGDAAAGAFGRAALHVPTSLVDAASAELERIAPDCCVSIGGGSAIGLGKALAVRTGLPLVSIPTTYSGSEMTDTWGTTEGGVKHTGRDARVAPGLVVYDPELTLSLPPEVSAASGMNAIAHAVEALHAPDANPFASAMADAALRTLARALPRVVRSPADLDARAEALEGAHFAGLALSVTRMGLHHKLCHVLGGAFGLDHALTHAILLPHVARFNEPAAPQAMTVVANALGTAGAAEGLFALERQLGIPRSLLDIGLRADQLDRAADLAVQAPYPNPRPAARDDVLRLLREATGG